MPPVDPGRLEMARGMAAELCRMVEACAAGGEGSPAEAVRARLARSLAWLVADAVDCIVEALAGDEPARLSLGLQRLRRSWLEVDGHAAKAALGRRAATDAPAPPWA